MVPQVGILQRESGGRGGAQTSCVPAKTLFCVGALKGFSWGSKYWGGATTKVGGGGGEGESHTNSVSGHKKVVFKDDTMFGT